MQLAEGMIISVDLFYLRNEFKQQIEINSRIFEWLWNFALPAYLQQKFIFVYFFTISWLLFVFNLYINRTIENYTLVLSFVITKT